MAALSFLIYVLKYAGEDLESSLYAAFLAASSLSAFYIMNVARALRKNLVEIFSRIQRFYDESKAVEGLFMFIFTNSIVSITKFLQIHWNKIDHMLDKWNRMERAEQCGMYVMRLFLRYYVIAAPLLQVLMDIVSIFHSIHKYDEIVVEHLYRQFVQRCLYSRSFHKRSRSINSVIVFFQPTVG